MNTPPLIFDRKLVWQHFDRAAPHFATHEALYRDTEDQIIERIDDVAREFTTALDLSPFPFLANRQPKMLVTASNKAIRFDEEYLPFTPESFELIVSNLGMHWVNDVPGALTQIRATLKPDGLFLATLVGEQSLRELRACLFDAELEVMGGVSPRMSPTIDLLTASQLMQRADFTLPVADKETVTLLYKDVFTLMRELRGMGQTNAHIQRLRHPTRRAIFFEAARLYQERFSNDEGLIPATFDIIYLHGWK